MVKPRFSIVIPIHAMQNWEFYLKRCLDSVYSQTYKDYEIIITVDGKYAENHNSGIRKARGELIKFLSMDDSFATTESLQILADTFMGRWMMTGCSNNLHPKWTDDIHLGNNKLGNPSCLTIRNDHPLFFDENLTWLVDVDYYKRMFDRYGQPTILDEVNVMIGEHPGQLTNLIPDEIKIQEFNYIKEKYA